MDRKRIKKGKSKPSKSDDIMILSEAARNSTISNLKDDNLDDLMKSMSQKYTYGYVAPKKVEKPNTPVQKSDIKENRGKNPKSMNVTPKKSVNNTKKSIPVDDNSDWSDNFEDEKVTKVVKKGKGKVKAVPVIDDNSDWSDHFEEEVKPKKNTKVGKKKKVEVVEDENSDWSDDFEEESIKTKKTVNKTKPTQTKSLKQEPVPVKTTKTTKKTDKKGKKDSEPQDMGMGGFMSLDDMMNMEFEQYDGEINGEDEFADMYSDEEAKEKEKKASKDEKKKKTSKKEKEQTKVSEIKPSKKDVSKPTPKNNRKMETSTVFDDESKDESEIEMDEDMFDDEDMMYYGEGEGEGDMYMYEGGFEGEGYYGYGYEGETGLDMMMDEDEDEDQEFEEDYDMEDEDIEDNSNTNTNTNTEVDVKAQNKRAREETTTTGLQRVDVEGKIAKYLTATHMDALEAALNIAHPSYTPLDHACRFIASSEVGRSGMLDSQAAHIVSSKNICNHLDNISKLLMLSELCRFNIVKDIAKSFHSLTDEYLKDNDFNQFEQWLLSARFNSLLLTPLPSKIPPTDVRKVIIKMLAKKKAPISKFCRSSPLPVHINASTDEQKDIIEENKKISLLSYDSRRTVRNSMKDKQINFIEDSLLPSGKAISEHKTFGKLLVARGANPELVVSICKNLNAKIENNILTIVDGGQYSTFNGDVKCEELWGTKPSDTEVLWGFPQHAKALLNKQIKMSVGKVSVTLSLMHFVKLFFLYFLNLVDIKNGLTQHNAPVFGEEMPSTIKEDDGVRKSTSPPPSQSKSKKGKHQKNKQEPVVEASKPASEYIDAVTMAKVTSMAALVLQHLPVQSTTRVFIGELLRKRHVNCNSLMEDADTIHNLMKQVIIKDKEAEKYSDEGNSKKKAKGKDGNAVRSNKLQKKLENYMLNGFAAEAALAANKNFVFGNPINLSFPRHFLQSVFNLVLRYRSLQGAGIKGGGNQASITHNCFDVLKNEFGVTMECFASPLNCYFNRYCSAFPDTDAMFGSLGSFFQFCPTSGSYQVNPPFDPEVILATSLHIEQLLGRAYKSPHPLSFIVIIPHADKQTGWSHLHSSQFLTGQVTIPGRQHAYYEGLQQNKKLRTIFHTARHDTSVFFLQNRVGEETWPITEDKVKKLITAFQKQFEL